MKISTKIRYGLRTMIEIAKSDPTIGIYQKNIAINQSLSLKYLDHIIHALKIAHLVKNSKGRKSGYVLTKKPSEITVLDIHNAFEPGICLLDCISSDFACERRNLCQAEGFWNKLNSVIISSMKSVTLEDLVKDKLRI